MKPDHLIRVPGRDCSCCNSQAFAHRVRRREKRRARREGTREIDAQYDGHSFLHRGHFISYWDWEVAC